MALTSPDNIWTPDSSDNYALTTDLAATADSIQDAITSLRGNNASTVKVANVAERNAVLADHGTPTTSNPLIVFRADAGAGRELEYTTNGTLWHTVAAEQDTGRVSLSPGGGLSSAGSNEHMTIRRIGKIVTLSVNVSKGTYSDGNAGVTLPVQFRPAGNNIYDSAISNSGGGTPIQVTLGSNGVLQFFNTGGLSNSNNIRWQSTWMVD